MRNPLLALWPERKGGVWGGALGTLLGAYLRESEGTGRITEDQAMRVATYAACVRLISATVAALPLGMYQTRLTGGGSDGPLETSLAATLTTPNAWQTGQEWREQLTGHVLSWGNGYAWVNWIQVPRDGQIVDVVQELLPLHPGKVQVEQDERTRVVRYWLHQDRGERIPIPAENMFHLRGFSSDGIRGRSILEDARESLTGALGTQRFANRLFENDATAGVILRHPGVLTESTAKKLREQWDELHRGHTRRTAVLEEGMTLEKLTIQPNDAQFLETREYQRAEIAGLFPVPPHLVGIVDRSTSWGTGIEQQNIQWLQYTLIPLIKRWENTIRRVLINQDRRFYVKHNLNGLLRGDATSRAGFYRTLVEIDAMTPNEVRELEERNPLAGGDRVWSEIQRARSAPSTGSPA